LGGVDVVDPDLDGPAEEPDRLVSIPRRAEHARPTQLHRAVAQTTHRTVGQGEGISHWIDATSAVDLAAQLLQAQQAAARWLS
jgi:hypothetical protein